jgi:methyl-accepting chemotaxis protein
MEKADSRWPGGQRPSEFRLVVEGMNRTMDALQRPVQLTAEYATRISQGDIPPPIEGTYAGDFDQIKVALNQWASVPSRLSWRTPGCWPWPA